MEKSNFDLPSPMMMVLLKKNLLLGSVATEKKLEQAIAGLSGATLTRSGEKVNESVMIHWAGYVFSAFVVNKPIPEQEFFACLNSSPDKKNLQKIVKSQKAHLIVSTLDRPQNPGNAIDLSIALMVVTHLISQTGDSIGYFWSNSGKLLGSNGFEAVFQDAMQAHIQHLQGKPQNPEILPLAYWVDIRLFSDSGKVAGMTQGLSLFTGYEVEIDFLTSLPEKIYSYLAGVISFVFTHGPILRDGESMKGNDEESFDLKFLKHPDSGKLLLRLTLVQSNN